MNYGSSTSSWKPWRWMRLHLNPLTNFTSTSRSTSFKDILPWNISEMITKTIPISTRIVIRYAMKWGILLWISWKVNGNWDNNMIRISQWRKAIVEQKKKRKKESVLVSEERKKSKRAGLWGSQSGIPVGKLTIWVRSRKKNYNRVH